MTKNNIVLSYISFTEKIKKKKIGILTVEQQNSRTVEQQHSRTAEQQSSRTVEQQNSKTVEQQKQSSRTVEQ